ncbi:MAG: efflux RND transporter permease subunit [Deltaproteobacteria bacterium]|nr:efflux RND transporter permease subunit [Deltaproteobacteria bacterium]
MWLADTSIKRPVFATMVILALVVFGIVSYPSIGVDLFPKVDFPMVTIYTYLRGASPEVVDVDVTDRIEEVVNTINGVKTINSSSSSGLSTVMIEFVLERDIDLAVQDVREKIASIRRRLPTDIEEPSIRKVDPDASPILWVNLTGNLPIRELSTYADEVLKEQLQRIDGVGALRMSGSRLRQIRIWLDAGRMKAFNIAANDVLRTLRMENIELPGGRIETDTKEFTVRIKGELNKIRDFNDLVVSYYNGAPVRIRDIGRAEDGMEEARSISRFNGQPSVGIGIQKQSGTNTVEVANWIKKELINIRNNLPPGINLEIALDQSTFITRSIKEVQGHLIIGAVLAIVAVFLFLGSLRTTLISAVALPVSIISTFAVMKAFDFTFNNMTMLALSLSVGILIDDAIIVIENIHRHMEEGMGPKEAASFATSEIGLAVMATTIAIVAIFLPVAFMKGIIGRFFLQFALTVVFAVLVSLFVSFTLTPMMASIFLKRFSGSRNNPGETGSGVSPIFQFGKLFDKGYRGIETIYRKMLAYTLNHRGIVLVTALIIFLASLIMPKFMGVEFTPAEDQSQFLVRMEAPGDYSIYKADELFKTAEVIVKDIPEVSSIFYHHGYGGNIVRAVFFTRLVPKAKRSKSQEVIKAELRAKLRKIPGLKVSVEEIAMIAGTGRTTPIQYSVRGSDLSQLKKYTEQIVSEFSKLPGIVDVDTSLEAGKPELSIYIDREKAADMGISISTIVEAVNLLFSGEVDVTKYKDDAKGKRYDVRVMLHEEDRNNPVDLGKISVRTREGKLVELANIVEINKAGGPTVINRVDRQRAVTIYANLENIPLGEAMHGLDAISAKILPPDYIPKYKGAADIMKESFMYLMFALLLGILLAYMVLAAQFESFIHPLTVLLSLPLSFIGAFGALMITGNTISIYSMIGLILLMGLVKKNAILLVDYTNVLRVRGLSRKEAILQAGPVRLRPILMTTFAMVFGMLPVAIGFGEGAESRSPMGIAVIGGLLTSLFLTLLVVPSAYDLFDDVGGVFTRRKKKGEKKGVSTEKS